MGGALNAGAQLMNIKPDYLRGQVEENGSEPEPEVGEDVHHRIEYDRRGGMLLRDVLAQLHDAIGLAAQASDGSGIVEGIARDGKSVDAPETDRRLFTKISFDDGLPGKGVEAIYHNPNAEDGDEPVACMTEVIPQLDKADIKGEQHDYACCTAKEEKQVIQSLLSPDHRLFAYRTIRDGG